jgi:hypothetical protein
MNRKEYTPDAVPLGITLSDKDTLRSTLKTVLSYNLMYIKQPFELSTEVWLDLLEPSLAKYTSTAHEVFEYTPMTPRSGLPYWYTASSYGTLNTPMSALFGDDLTLRTANESGFILLQSFMDKNPRLVIENINTWLPYFDGASFYDDNKAVEPKAIRSKYYKPLLQWAFDYVYMNRRINIAYALCNYIIGNCTSWAQLNLLLPCAVNLYPQRGKQAVSNIKGKGRLGKDLTNPRFKAEYDRLIDDLKLLLVKGAICQGDETNVAVPTWRISVDGNSQLGINYLGEMK